MSALANITSPEFMNRIGLGSKRIVHRIVLVRHGETVANFNMMNNSFDPNKKFLNTPLSPLGHQQAENTANYLDNIGFVPNYIIVSRLVRALDTAKPFIEKNIMSGIKNKIPVLYDETITEYNHSYDDTIHDKYGTWNYKKESREEFINRVSDYVLQLKNSGSIQHPKQTLIYTHSQVISCMLTNAIMGIKTETNTFFHLANGSITCMDIDEDGKFHIHAVNYTKHLEEPTGQHSPFV